MFKVKWVWKVFVVILLGALGSGIWEYILKSFFLSGSHLFLSVVTLGLDTVKDGIYAEAAKGFHEYASIQIVVFIVFVLSLSMGMVSGVLYKMFFKKKRLSVPDDIPYDEQKKNDKTLRLMLYFVSIAFLLVAFVELMNLANLAYANTVVTYFNQSFTICKPYLSKRQEEKMLSDFAQVHSKDDFVEINESLKEIASQNDVTLPAFTIW